MVELKLDVDPGPITKVRLQIDSVRNKEQSRVRRKSPDPIPTRGALTVLTTPNPHLHTFVLQTDGWLLSSLEVKIGSGDQCGTVSYFDPTGKFLDRSEVST